VLVGLNQDPNKIYTGHVICAVLNADKTLVRCPELKRFGGGQLF